MANWATVRYDPTYEEKLDPEIVPLCDAMNAAGFITTSSCVGHGSGWPHVWFEHSSDERIERLARFVKTAEVGDYRPYFTMWQKEILPDGYAWSVEIHTNEVYCDTLDAVRIEKENGALAALTRAVREFHSIEDKRRIVRCPGCGADIRGRAHACPGPRRRQPATNVWRRPDRTRGARAPDEEEAKA